VVGGGNDGAGDEPAAAYRACLRRRDFDAGFGDLLIAQVEHAFLVVLFVPFGMRLGIGLSLFGKEPRHSGNRCRVCAHALDEAGCKARQQRATCDPNEQDPDSNHECRPAIGLSKPRRFI
jgi:hypothetical protein